ncbi:NAD-binding protein [Streptomyces sp. NPDC002055]|uniref:NAD-binding protein n=1 Tax=Streptomyces sp. NPDC002055 TaxID=3154534 RepID=UPI0033269E90
MSEAPGVPALGASGFPVPPRAEDPFPLGRAAGTAGAPPEGNGTPPGRYYVVIGGDVARKVCGTLQAAGHTVCHLTQPTDEELRAALAPDGTAPSGADPSAPSATPDPNGRLGPDVTRVADVAGGAEMAGAAAAEMAGAGGAEMAAAGLTDTAGAGVTDTGRVADTAEAGLADTGGVASVADTGGVAGVAILLDDVESLRYALAVEHIRPHVRLVVTIFDRTVAEQLVRVVPNCRVTSPADVVAPTFLAACIEPGLVSLSRTESGHAAAHWENGSLRRTPYRAPRALRYRARAGRLRGQLRPHDGSSRIMLAGLAGLLTVLLSDWAWLVFLHHRPPVEALFEATRTVSTVGPASPHGPDTPYLVFGIVAMLITMAFTAVFTAGMVDRMLAPRSVGIVGPRALPRAGHVVVVGLGQVGLRLCTELQDLGIGVIAVERDPQAPNLRLARALGVPVVVADAQDRFVLRELGLHRAQALAAVASDDLDNIAVSVAALAVAPDLRIVIRAGDHEAIAETRSLFRIGLVHDLGGLSAAYTTASLYGAQPPRGVLVQDGRLLVENADGTLLPWPEAERCDHAQDESADGRPAAGRTVPGPRLRQR